MKITKQDNENTVPFQITFRDMDSSDAVWMAVQDRIDKLERLFDRLIFCEVVISSPHHHHEHGRIYSIKVHLRLPGEDIFVNREPERNMAHTDIYIAIRDTFDAVDRKLEDFVRKIRHHTKNHTLPPIARILRVFPVDGYGFIETPDAREIYFHENSILNADIDKIEVGQKVRFAEEMGEKGPQVTSMSVIKPA